jgi:hypothetical protein
MADAKTVGVRIRQVWEDTDARGKMFKGRRLLKILRVPETDGGENIESLVVDVFVWYERMPGVKRHHKVKLGRFLTKPCRYELVSEGDQ